MRIKTTSDKDIVPLQNYLLMSMKELDKCFRKHQLRYYMIGGTMLGAVRHKGFIPWDDDVDIAMPRRDYELLKANWTKWLPEYMEFVDFESDQNYRLHFGKVQDKRTTVIENAALKYVGGVYVDIFPFDGVPSNSLLRWWHIKRFDLWHRINYYMYRDPYKQGHGPSSWLPRFLQSVLSRKNVQLKLRKIMMECDFDNSDFVSHHNNQSPTHWFPRSVIGNPTSYEFGDTMFSGVEQYDDYLTEYYGSTYMKVPPVEKRGFHSFHFLDLNTPYKDYLANKNGR